MRHLRYLTFLLILIPLAPSTARAITLEWAGGASEITVTTIRPCTLLVKPSPGETHLPLRWRLFWAGTSEVDKPVQVTTQPGPGGSDYVCDFQAPASEEDRLSKTSTADFCGPGGGEPGVLAAYVINIDPSLHARFTVAPAFGALPETESDGAVVTVNGGSNVEFPAELRTFRALPDTLGVQRAGIVGSGLDRVRSVRLVHPGTNLPDDSLEILSQDARTLLLSTPDVADDHAVLVLSNGDQEAVTAASLADPAPTQGGFGPHMVPDYPYEAKDFAFIYAFGQYHIFYDLIDPLSPGQSEVEFGHAVSQNLYNWTQLPRVMHTRPGKFDDTHVWAPSIVEQNGTFYMFYTGVGTNPIFSEPTQRIGVAISTDLLNWTRFDDPIFDCTSVPWTDCDHATWEGNQFRDPFVMADPDTPGDWLMYYVAIPASDPSQQIVGVGQSPALMSGWTDLMPMWCTDKFPPHYGGWNESPMVMSKAGLYLMFVSTNSGHPIAFRTASSPTADSTGWSTPYRLYDMQGAGANTDVWIAPEFLRNAGHDYFAAVSRAAVSPGVEIREMTWGAIPLFSLNPPEVTAVEPGAAPATIHLAMTSPIGSGEGVDFRVDLASPGRARVEIYDVSGRKVAEVLDAWLPSGSSGCRWDGRTSEKGARAESGIYFARLVANHETRTIRVPHVR